jgi:hypothetical protein
VFGGGGDGEDGCGEHGEGDPPVPGGPSPDLMPVQACQGLAGLDVLLDGPPEPGYLDQGGEGDLARAVAAVERQFAGGAVAADQQVTMPGAGDGDPGPVVMAVSLAPSPAASHCQALRGRRVASSSARRVWPAPAATR